MNAMATLSAVRMAGGRVYVDDEGLGVKAPRGAITDDLRGALTRRKPELLAILTGTEIPPSQPQHVKKGSMVAVVDLGGTYDLLRWQFKSCTWDGTCDTWALLLQAPTNKTVAVYHADPDHNCWIAPFSRPVRLWVLPGGCSEC